MSRTLSVRGAIVACLLGVLVPTGGAAEAFEWETATPESQGLSGEKLQALKDDLAAQGTWAAPPASGAPTSAPPRRSSSATGPRAARPAAC